MSAILFRQEVYDIVGAAMDVYNELGSGFLENVYEEALTIELERRSIPFVGQAKLHIRYKDTLLQKFYIADVIAFNQIIVEIKALEKLSSREEAQLINYLKATGFKVSVLLNFGSPEKLEWKRMILTKTKSRALQTGE